VEAIGAGLRDRAHLQVAESLRDRRRERRASRVRARLARRCSRDLRAEAKTLRELSQQARLARALLRQQRPMPSIGTWSRLLVAATSLPTTDPGSFAGDSLADGDSGLVLESRRENDRLVLQAKGKLDAVARQPFIEVAAAAVVGGATVVVDMSMLAFIDASGLSALAACVQASLEAGGRFSVRGASGQVAYLLEATGLAELLTDANM
jgi:anti-sigma B factor antagonist